MSGIAKWHPWIALPIAEVAIFRLKRGRSNAERWLQGMGQVTVVDWMQSPQYHVAARANLEMECKNAARRESEISQ